MQRCEAMFKLIILNYLTAILISKNILRKDFRWVCPFEVESFCSSGTISERLFGKFRYYLLLKVLKVLNISKYGFY